MSNEVLYIIRDSSGAIYGPASLATLRQWISEGRITQQMELAPQGTRNFVRAGQMVELVSAFSPGAAAPTAAASPAPTMQTPAAAPVQGGGNQTVYQRTVYSPYVQKSSGLAIASLVCSLCGIIMCMIPPVLGIIFGHIAKGQIRREPDRYEGEGMATAGMIIGYCMLGFHVLIIGFYVVMIIIAASTAATAPRSSRPAPRFSPPHFVLPQ